MVTTLNHEEAKRKNIPTAEYESLVEPSEKTPIQVAYKRRDPDLDPQLIWRAKYEGPSDLVVPAQPLFIQEKVHPKALIDDLLRESRERRYDASEIMPDLFADFNGIPHGVDKTEFYKHDQNWSNRMILGDSLLVMTSLSEREGLRGKVQCIYIDPPYGIKFNSNFQWSTTSRTVKDGNIAHITREPEQVKAFRDTWRDGIHSYLTYLRDRLTVASDLLADSGSVFVQMGEENVHRVRALMDEVFGDSNYIAEIAYHSTSGSTSDFLSNPKNYVLWYAKDASRAKFREMFLKRPFSIDSPGPWQIVERDGIKYRLKDFIQQGGDVASPGVRVARLGDVTSQRQGREAGDTSAMGFPFCFQGKTFRPSGTRGWSATETGLQRAAKAGRLYSSGESLSRIRYFDESPYTPLNSSWEDTGGTIGAKKLYVVQTNVRVIQRCILMATDPGDLVLDPTCGSGTTAAVAEQWGRRWITIDTSRVALALARSRIMGARFPYYILADSRGGQVKEAELSRSMPRSNQVNGDVRHGFVYERVPHVSLKSLANNSEIDVIWDKHLLVLDGLRKSLNAAIGKVWEEWEIPRDADQAWSAEVKHVHSEWWQRWSERQRAMDESIEAKKDFDYIYDKPYEDKKIVRVAGPFTVESLSPHRVLGVGVDDELIDPLDIVRKNGVEGGSFAEMILEDLRIAGVQQAHKVDKIVFTALTPWPGDYICADGRYIEGDTESGTERRVAIFIGPEFSTVRRADLVAAAREAADAGFNVLIACAFAYEARTTDFNKLGSVPVLKARMNADLHMSDDLKNTGKGNLFVIFGEPDIEIIYEAREKLRVKIKGVDVFKPNTGEVISNGSDGIACWFVDTDYNEESFFVRHAYFLGAGDPYGSLKTTLKAEIDADAWSSLNSDTSRAFPKPKSGRIAVKVINHLGDEVMKVFKVD